MTANNPKSDKYSIHNYPDWIGRVQAGFLDLMSADLEQDWHNRRLTRPLEQRVHLWPSLANTIIIIGLQMDSLNVGFIASINNSAGVKMCAVLKLSRTPIELELLTDYLSDMIRDINFPPPHPRWANGAFLERTAHWSVLDWAVPWSG
jgi:hypothetical protein